MKRAVSIILVIIMVILISACSKEDDNAVNTEPYINASQGNEETLSVPTIYSAFSSFNEGLAWVKYKENDEFYGCIDESGKMLFRISCDNFIDYSNNFNLFNEFENGYSYLQSNSSYSVKDTVYVIDNTGEICGLYSNVKAYGYGYVVTESYHSDFVSRYYEYQFIDPSGEVVKTFRTDGDEKALIRYCNEGVFYFEISDSDIHMYFASADKWVKYNYAPADYDIYFNNGVAFTESDYTYVILYSDGRIVEVENEYNIFRDKRQNKYPYSDCILFYNDDKPALASYNLRTQTATFFEDIELLEKFETHYDGNISSVDIYPKCNDEGFVVDLVGTDGYGYSAIFDYDFNMQGSIIENFTDKSIAYKNNTCNIDDEVYDMKGNFLYVLGHTSGLNEVIAESENILAVLGTKEAFNEYGGIFVKDSTKYNYYFIDKDGKKIFEKIDTSEVVTIGVQ